MLKKLVTSVIGTRFERDLKRIQPVIDQIHDCEKQLSSSSEAELKAQAERFRGVVKDRVGTIQQQLEMRRAEKHACADPERRDELDDEVHELEEKYKGELGKVLDDILPEAFATVREACRRLLGTKVLVTGLELEWEMVPYDVQLIGGIILHEGKIAEMATGEGKTLVATLPIYLNALAKRGVHVVTVNNYLARRDSQWMGHLLKYLGLTVGCLDDTQPSSAERRAAYECDVTYGTNNEFGFDYLRDNMVFQLEQRVQREHAYAIIDEVDSILVDEARTPLIISGPVGNEGDEKYQEFNPRIQGLIRKQTGVANELIASAERLLEDEEQRYEGGVKLFQVQKGMPKNKRFMKLIQEPETKQLLQRVELDWLADRKLPAKDQRFKDFEDQLCFIMDERGRSVHLTDLGVEEMSPDDPNLFVVPDISEAVGVLERDESLSPQERLEKRRDLDAEYAAKSEKLHIIHKLLQAHSLYEKDVEYVVQDGQVFIVDEFTGRIMAGRRWSDGLHQAIEAKEGVKIRGETQTLATITIQNFFRMYDKLSGMTGTAETEETEFFQIYGLEVMVIPTNRPVRRVDHHDLLYQSRREKYTAVIEEIERHHERGLPILVGTVSVEVSETLARMLKRRGLKFEVLNAKQHQREAEIITQAGRPGAITIATNMAGRGTDIKLGAGVKQCDICGIKSKVAPFGQNIATPDLSVDEIRKRGCNDEPPCGLTVIGTERHESRRIDRQLRGRSGRQGDPGQSVFFLSLEDDLMRLFVSDRVAKFMEKTGVEEGEVLTHPWFTKAIENAQKRVELQNFQARKKLLEYDDVMNQQREVIYSQRLFALEGGEELKAEALKMIGSALSKFAEEAGAEEPENWDRSLMRTDLMMRYLVPAPVIEDEERVSDLSALESAVQEAGKAAFDARLASWDELSSRYSVPDLSEKLLAQVSLQVLDEKWKDHLYDLDQLRNAIHYRAWGQKDPLIEYKKEAFDLFVGLMADIRSTFAERFFKFQVQVNAPPPRQAVPQRVQMRHDTATDADLMVGAGGGNLPPGPMSTSGPGDSGSTVVAPQKADVKVGRNDPCPCGSGKKYKKCHGRA
ncbi:MAG: preprotein translocase subunit SecA [Gemmatimonadetes bacterium]|nr:preprotein translocase subunit SecA [Gemmatimonadota bacterium]